MTNEQQLMESVNYMNGLAESIVVSEEINELGLKVMEHGFKSLTNKEHELVAAHLKMVVELTFTAEFMKHAAVIAQMYDETIATKVKEIDWSMIEKPIKNKKDMSEFEYKKTLKELKIFESLGTTTNPTSSVGFDENGRPYTRNVLEGIDVTVYLDTRECIVKGA